MMTYPDPLNPQEDANDYLRGQTTRVGQDTVTWASGTASSPSKSRSRFQLPKVGLLARLFVDIDGGSATAYDFTAGGGTGAVAADGMGPWGIVEGFALKINGGSGWFDVSGFGTFLLNNAENPNAYTGGSVPGTAWSAVAGVVYAYDPTADSRPRFGFTIPVALDASQPLGMVLLQNDQTTVELEIRWATLDKFAALAGGASATLSLTATIVAEYYDVPPLAAFDAYIRPLLRWANWHIEERQDVSSTGRDANIVTLDNHDTYLRVIQHAVLNGALNTAALEAVRLVLNRQTTLYDHSVPVHFRQQRDKIAKDLPAIVWDFFATGTLRDVLHADSFTDIRTAIDVASGTTLGSTAFIRTMAQKLVDLGGAPAATGRPA